MALVSFEMSAKDRELLLDDSSLSQDLRNALQLATPLQRMDYGTPLDFYLLEVSNTLATETHGHAKRLQRSGLQRDVKTALDGATKEER